MKVSMIQIKLSEVSNDWAKSVVQMETTAWALGEAMRSLAAAMARMGQEVSAWGAQWSLLPVTRPIRVRIALYERFRIHHLPERLADWLAFSTSDSFVDMLDAAGWSGVP